MRRLLSCAEASELDRLTRERAALPSLLLMEDASLRIWEVERLPRPPVAWSPAPNSLVVAALATAGAGLAAALGLLWGLLALVATVIFLVAIGAHGG